MGDTSINILQHLSLTHKVLIHRIRLAEHAVRHVMRPIDALALIEHVVRLFAALFETRCRAERRDVVAHGGEEVSARAGFGDCVFETGVFAAVVGEGAAVEGEVLEFGCGGGEGGFGVEEAGEGGDGCFALVGVKGLVGWDWRGGLGGGTLERISWSFRSVWSSSSVGFVGGLEAKDEYVWNRFSV